MKAIGETVKVDDEHLMDAYTAVSGSGPAYIFYFVEAIISAAKEMGIDEKNARTRRKDINWFGLFIRKFSSKSSRFEKSSYKSKRHHRSWIKCFNEKKCILILQVELYKSPKKGKRKASLDLKLIECLKTKTNIKITYH